MNGLEKKAEWLNDFAEGKELVLATCSLAGRPNANIVMSLGFIDDGLLIANCQMETTIDNLNENRRVVVIGGYYRIIGEVELYSAGKYFDVCAEKSKGYTVRNAILVRIEEIFDLDKQKTAYRRSETFNP